MKSKEIFACILMMFGVLNGLQSQIKDFDFHYVGAAEISYDFPQYIISVQDFPLPDTNYISIISKFKGTSIISRCDNKEKYLFPLRVQYNDTVYLMVFTVASLYDIIREDYPNMSIYEFELWVKQILVHNDTLPIRFIPRKCAGSANYYTLSALDPELTLVRHSKWLFLNFFFKKNEDGIRYDYIGEESQIAGVVSQLYSWSIPVSDGCGSDQINKMFIELSDYPESIGQGSPSDIQWMESWLHEFDGKHVIGNKLIERSEWEQWNTIWRNN